MLAVCWFDSNQSQGNSHSDYEGQSLSVVRTKQVGASRIFKPLNRGKASEVLFRI